MFLLTGDKFLPEMHLKQPRFIYSACGIQKNSKIQKNRRYWLYWQNELDKACFQHDMACRDFKDLKRRTCSDKVLRDKAFKIASDQKYDWYQRGLASMI